MKRDANNWGYGWELQVALSLHQLELRINQFFIFTYYRLLQEKFIFKGNLVVTFFL